MKLSPQSQFSAICLTRTRGVICSTLMLIGVDKPMREVTLHDVAQLTEGQILATRGGGPKTVADARRVLALAGLDLKL